VNETAEQKANNETEQKVKDEDKHNRHPANTHKYVVVSYLIHIVVGARYENTEDQNNCKL